MQKSINITLYKSLLLTDFNFIKSNTVSNYRTTSNIITKGNTFYYLDLLESIKTLKILIRGISFIKQGRKMRLILRINNFQYYKVLVDFTKSNPLPYKVVLLYDKLLPKQYSFDLTCFYVFFGDYRLSHKANHFYRQLLLQKIFLIMHINFQIEYQQYGAYKFYTDTTDFKKIIFLLLLIKKVLINPKEKNALS